MRAQMVSTDLKDKYVRILRDGLEAFDLAQRAPTSALSLGHMLDAGKHFAQAWAVADTACTLVPSSGYKGWLDRRSTAFRHEKATRERIIGLIGAISGQVVRS